MEVHLGQTRLRLHPLMLMFPFLGFFSGASTEMNILLLSLSFHEFSHWLTARAMHVNIEKVYLMPFGGSAYIGNPYLLTKTQLFVTAMAGPLSNLLLLFVCAALAHWTIIPSYSALAALHINMYLMLFNLIPALPLDGGRMLYALLFQKMGCERAVNMGIWLGRILSGIMLIVCLTTWICFGIINPSFIISAVFILAAAPKERSALCSTRVSSLINGLRSLNSPVQANLYMVSPECTIRSALRAASPNMASLYAVCSDRGLKSFISDRQLTALALERSPDISISDI